MIWFRNYVGDAFKYGVKYRGVRRPLTYCPALILLPYLTTICSAHFEIDTFAHNDHDGYVQFSTNLTQKKKAFVSKRQVIFYLHSASSGAFPILLKLRLFLHSNVWNIFLEEVHLWSNKANLRDLIAATGLMNLFGLCDLEIRPMALKNNRGLLPCPFQLCVSFHSHRCIWLGLKVWKCLNRGKTGILLSPMTTK